MRYFTDIRGRVIGLTDERRDHLETGHPEMRGQMDRIGEVLQAPERIVLSRSDPTVELYYKLYEQTPVTKKFLCVVVKSPDAAGFIVTAYYTDTVKKGTTLWPTK